MKKIFFTLNLMIIIISHSISQDYQYLEGYIITDKNDTITGKLKLLSEEKRCIKVILNNSNNKETEYTDEQVKSYKIGEEIYFQKPTQRATANDGIALMKLLAKGYVNLYEYKYSAANMMGGFGYNYTIDCYLERGNRLFLVRKVGFRETMLSLFSDNSELCDQIQDKKLKFENITEIVDIYNKFKSQ